MDAALTLHPTMFVALVTPVTRNFRNPLFLVRDLFSFLLHLILPLR